MLKAAAGLSAMAAAGGYSPTVDTPVNRVSAQEVDGVRGREWVEAENISMGTMSAGDGWITMQAEFPFWAVGIGWDGSGVLWPVIEVQVSADGADWGEVWTLTGREDDLGSQAEQDRTYTDLLFTDGQQFIRYRTLDGEGNPSPVPGLAITYIDPTDGPWEDDRPTTMMRTSAANDDTDAPPSIITRAQWGANESLRFDSFGEIWPAEYATVEHAIVHHAAVNYGTDGYNAVRSIYYYHCVTQGWGDIGYNYLIDTRGNIFEGRVGGQNVIGGHSYEYAIGSSGICIMGDFRYQAVPENAKAALAHIIAFVIRDLDPYGRKQFHQIANLPTICAHRDVNQTSCPGQYLYDDLPEIRDTVAATLDAHDLDTGNPAGIVPGDRVVVQTDDGGPLNLRSAPNSGSVLTQIPNGRALRILEGPRILAGGNWYKVSYGGSTGWVIADYLIVTPPPPPQIPDQDYAFGTNVRFTSSTNVRRSPGTSAGILGTATRNTWSFIMAGPRSANSYEWYQVRVPGIGDGWVIKGNLAESPVNENPSSHAFGLRQSVVTRRAASLRVRPGAAQTVASTIPSGTGLTISVAPVSTTGENWYGLSSPGYGGGWVREADLAADPDQVFRVGDAVQFVTSRAAMKSTISLSAPTIAIVERGVTGTVLSGTARSGDGYRWVYLRTPAGTGWVVNYALAKTAAVTPPTLRAGDRIRVIQPLNMRTTYGTDAPIITTLSTGTTGTVLSGSSRSADGYQWAFIEVGSRRGWVVTVGVQNLSTPKPPSGKFSIGQSVRVTEALNIRSGPSTGNGVITTLPAGTTGTVLDGPRSGSGYTWWRIQTSRGTGWGVQDWLAASGGSSSTGSGFRAGDSFRVTETLNMRSGAGTGNGVIATLPAGTTGTITAGSHFANGYTWWPVRTNYGSGWVAADWIVKT